MNNKKVETSRIAIQKYSVFRAENAHRHKAKVFISSKGRTCFEGTLWVCPIIDEHEAFIQIEGNIQFERSFHTKYTSEQYVFKRIRGTMQIEAMDIWGNSIHIEITGI